MQAAEDAGRSGAGAARAAVAVALAQSAHFSASATAIGEPTCLYLGLLAKVTAVAACLSAFPPRAAAKRAPLPWAASIALAALFALSVALLCLPLPTPAAYAAAFVFYGCEMSCYILSGLLAVESAGPRVADAALAGMVGAFCLALVSFSLPAAFSAAFQATVAFAAPLYIAHAFQAPGRFVTCHATAAADSGQDASPGRPRRSPLSRLAVPPILAAVLALFMAGMQFTYVNLGEECDWSATFAIATAVSLAVLVVETRFLRGSRLSLLDIICSLMIAVPVILVGTGTRASSLSVSMASIGMYLFLPRVLQIAASDDEGQPPDIAGRQRRRGKVLA